jgi:hypothetical protein
MRLLLRSRDTNKQRTILTAEMACARAIRVHKVDMLGTVNSSFMLAIRSRRQTKWKSLIIDRKSQAPGASEKALEIS